MNVALRNCALLAALALSPLAGGHEITRPAPPTNVQRTGAELEVLAVRAEFSKALRAGDLATVERLLAPDVLVLEGGGAERSRGEYLASHAPADAAFLGRASITELGERVQVTADLAWIGSESRIGYQKNGVARTVTSTETMVLKRGAEGWQIAHIHWSSGD